MFYAVLENPWKLKGHTKLHLAVASRIYDRKIQYFGANYKFIEISGDAHLAHHAKSCPPARRPRAKLPTPPELNNFVKKQENTMFFNTS